ncbi:MAG: hypothetical protein CBB71_02475 [Rhodopirellula sp. TMED11]|nr:MAG: hypothetical protein CBB71_02475 [Rhodopirellula sp. TMED11]
MSESKVEATDHGMVAEFTTVDSLLAACRRVRDAGYIKTDAFTPFPVHGIDKALGIKPTILPWICLVAGITGTMTALVMQIWMNSIDYQYIISGKPFLSLPAFIPVAFELTILFAAFAAFFGMWALNGLPKFSNPVFTDPRFDRATDDRFFLYIDSSDERYDEEGVRALLGETGSDYINKVVEDESPKQVPKFIYSVWALSVAASIIPLLCVLTMRVTNSSKPRFHIFPDMDFSPARDAQQTTSLFGDNRAMRPDVPGTVARGQLSGSMEALTGIDFDALMADDPGAAAQLVAAYQDEAAGTTTPPAEPVDDTPWLDHIPVTVDEALLARGKQQFGIYCSVCHGMSGLGNGLVNQRATEKQFDTWVPPSNLHDTALYSETYPDGKLFSTITNGVRKMAGYASQIEVQDRWAIVAYVRALQLSQNAPLDVVPAEKQAEVKAAVEAAKENLKRQEEAAAKAAAEREKEQN